ncbi:MAG: peptide-methionine (R)-S-oxide reductase MsrB [Magnetococcales bacterium]|nr:peptide-methionine (R)-S-oxide reductase MsrB [Magnetococcales bacterium]NGZ26091.1 peptide-methionine (R)-S-oxide reductase MsrB [Magnetococcales bacterium]
MQRRNFLRTMLTGWALWPLLARSLEQEKIMKDTVMLPKDDNEWRQRLAPEAFHVLRQEGTERPFTSPLNQEKRQGTFVCAGCDLPLFDSSMKYESGTGWPSFFTTLPGAVETRLDFKLLLPRTEYHCSRCGGHQGHVFDDGPPPTGKRYCNNGVALRFVPS